MLKKMLFMLSIVLVGSCSYEPEPIDLGNDLCHHCNMVITDARFGGQIITTTGKKFKFDAVECMAAFCNHDGGKTNIKSIYTINYDTPGTWLDVNAAAFLHSESVPSPMGMNLSAYARDGVNEKGAALAWTEVRSLVATSWSGKGR